MNINKLFILLILLVSVVAFCTTQLNPEHKFDRENNGRYKGGKSTDDTIYIESSKQQNQHNSAVHSASNCPDPLFGIPFISHEESGKCYLAGVKGPCPENMRIFPQHGSSFGFCDCNCGAYLENKYHSPRSYCTGKTDAGDIRSLAYVKGWGSCHPLLEQGNCDAGYWLAFGNDPRKGPFCERAVCEVTSYDLKFYDGNTRKCERLESQCRTTTMSNKGTIYGTYQFQDTDWIPICIPEDEFFIRNAHPEDDKGQKFGKGHSDTEIPLLNCPQGSQYSRISGTCQHRTYVGPGLG